MPNKNKKDINSEPLDIIGLVGKIIHDSAVTIFWESVDQFKKDVKVKLEISLQLILSALAVVVGLIFVLNGISGFLDEYLGVKGIGYILIGVLVVVGGIWVAEKAKERNKN